MWSLGLLMMHMNIIYGREIKIQLRAKWDSSKDAMWLESSEFIADTSNEAFWRLVNTPRNHDNDNDNNHEKVVDEMMKELSMDQKPFLELALDTRMYSTRIELHRTLALESKSHVCNNDTNTWAILYTKMDCAGAVYCASENSNITEVIERMMQQQHDDDDDDVLPGTCAAVSHNDFEQEFDHIYTSSTSKALLDDAITIVVYSLWTTSSFLKDIHSAILFLAEEGKVKYILRHAPLHNTIPTPLQGYGVALDVKNMEYKAIDDVDLLSHDERNGGVDDDTIHEFIYSLLTKRDNIQESVQDFTKTLSPRGKKIMKKWNLKNIGLQSVSRIIQSNDPLQEVQSIAQDFPQVATELVLDETKIPLGIATEVGHNVPIIESLQLLNTFFINGIPMSADTDRFNAFKFIRIVQSEFSLVEKMEKLKLNDKMKNKLKQAAMKITKHQPIRIDIRPSIKYIVQDDNGPLPTTVPFFLNDITTAEHTVSWPTSITELDTPSLHLKMMRRNMYEMVIVIDPMTIVGLQALNGLLFFLQRGAPLNCGLVFTTSTWMETLHGATQQQVNTFEMQFDVVKGQEKNIIMSPWYLTKLLVDVHVSTSDPLSSIRFLLHLISYIQPSVDGRPMVTTDIVIQAYVAATEDYFTTREATVRAYKAIGSKELNVFVLDMITFPSKKGLQLNSYLFNGLVQNNLNFQQDIMTLITSDQHVYMDLHSRNVLNDNDNLYHTLLKHENTYLEYLDVMDTTTASYISLSNDHYDILSNIHYLTSSSEDHVVVIHQSLFLFVDLNLVTSVEYVILALQYLTTSGNTIRLSIVNTEASDTIPSKGNVMTNLFLKKNDDIVSYNKLLLNCLVLLLDSIQHETSMDVFYTSIIEIVQADVKMMVSYEHSVYLKKVCQVFRVKSDETTVILNARKVPLSSLTTLSTLSTLLAFDGHTRTSFVADALRRDNEDDDKSKSSSDLIMIASSILGEYCLKERFDLDSTLDTLQLEHTLVVVPGGEVSITAFLDPISESAQRISPLLLLLSESFNANIRIVLVPKMECKTFPIHRFFRFHFGIRNGDSLLFTTLPTLPLLTLKMETPEPWNVQLSESDVDLDNLRGKDSVDVAIFTLQGLLVTGQCQDVTTLYLPPPNGLQLVLEKGHGKDLQHRDTLVMQNLGYFQLQATPGIWSLSLATGRASELYELVEVGKHDTFIPTSSKRIIIRDFDTDIMHLSVRKQVGKEKMILLENQKESTSQDDQEEKGLWASMSSYFYKEKENVVVKNSDETIHVFSLASGHLYERFLKIMMLSVIKRTENPVQFWLLENFLSPSFKESIPILKEQFGISITLITYKWYVL